MYAVSSNIAKLSGSYQADHAALMHEPFGIMDFCRDKFLIGYKEVSDGKE